MGEIFVNNRTRDYILSGNSWIFGKNIKKSKKCKKGEKVCIFDEKGDFFASGYYNPDSLIKVRILHRGKEDVEFNRDFFYRKIKKSLDYRKKIFPDKSSYRLIFSEGDFFPGLICDVFNKGIVCQVNTLGIEKYMNMVYEILTDIFSPDFIYEKTSDDFEKKADSKIIYGNIPEIIEIKENNIKYLLNIEGFQKTGFFLDQYLNRKKLEFFSKDAEVLDIFCNTGGFGLNALQYGAGSVDFMDGSSVIMESVKENVKNNGFNEKKCDYIVGDAFDFLSETKKKYDLIILDPPALTKNKKNVSSAVKAYLYLNIKAMDLLKENGVIATFSCSQNVTFDIFSATVKNASLKSSGNFSLIDNAIQSYDHPIVVSQPETHYLKGQFLRNL